MHGSEIQAASAFGGDDIRGLRGGRVRPLLEPDGLWLSVSGSTEGAERDHGPPRRSARDLVQAIEPVLEIVELRTGAFHANVPSPARAWICLARKRRVPAQPSTRR